MKTTHRLNRLPLALASLFLATLTTSAGPALAGHPPGDVAPGVLDESTDPPSFLIEGDGRVSIGDVVTVLRASVGLQELVHEPDPANAELQARVEELEGRLATLESLLVHLSRDGDELVISGANLHLRNGEGATDSANGQGNLVIGYNEARGFLEDDRSGSHSLILGSRNNFSGHANLVTGDSNEASGAHATVLGGINNIASGFAASVTGGEGNIASGLAATVTAGFGNIASGDHSSVSGGTGNEALALGSAVSGGFGNLALGPDATVSGGLLNEAIGEGSTVGGGELRTASGESDFVAGSIQEDQ